MKYSVRKLEPLEEKKKVYPGNTETKLLFYKKQNIANCPTKHFTILGLQSLQCWTRGNLSIKKFLTRFLNIDPFLL